GGPGEPDTGRRGPGDRTLPGREECEMQSTETVLGVLRSPESPVLGNGYAGFGGGAAGKGPAHAGTSPCGLPCGSRASTSDGWPASAMLGPARRCAYRRTSRAARASRVATAPTVTALSTMEVRSSVLVLSSR